MEDDEATGPSPQDPIASPEDLEKFLSLENEEGGTLKAVEALLRARLLKLQSAYDEYLRTRDALLRLLDKQLPEDRDLAGLEVEFPGGRVGTEGDSARRKPLGKRKESIVSLIEKFPGIEVWKIAQVEGISPSRVSQVVSTLVDEGRLVRTEAGLKVAPYHKNKDT